MSMVPAPFACRGGFASTPTALCHEPLLISTLTPRAAEVHPRRPVLEMAITPDGKTLYAAAINKVVPISTATNTPGKPIRPVSPGIPREIVITP
jgi:hypothetical protein